MSFFLDRINSSPSSSLVNEMNDYIDSLSDDVVLHVLHYCVDEQKVAWSYIRAILNRYVRDGLTDMDKVKADEGRKKSPKDSSGTNINSDGNRKTMDQVRRLRERINGG